MLPIRRQIQRRRGSEISGTHVLSQVAQSSRQTAGSERFAIVRLHTCRVLRTFLACLGNRGDGDVVQYQRPLGD